MTEIPDSGNSQQAMPAPVRRGPKWGMIALALVLIVGAGAFAGWWFLLRAQSPEQVVQRFIDSAKAGDYDRMVSSITRDSAKLITKEWGGKQGLERGMKEVADDFGQARVLSTTLHKDGKTAVVRLKPKTGQGWSAATDTSDFVLARESGQWKIDIGATVALAMKAAMEAGFGSGGGSGG